MLSQLKSSDQSIKFFLRICIWNPIDLNYNNYWLKVETKEYLKYVLLL